MAMKLQELAHGGDPRFHAGLRHAAGSPILPMAPSMSLQDSSSGVVLHILKIHYVSGHSSGSCHYGIHSGLFIYRFILIRVRGMATSEIIGSYAMGLAILEGLRWGGFKGMTYTLPVFIEGSIEIGGIPVDFQRMIVVGIGIGGHRLYVALHPLSTRSAWR